MSWGMEVGREFCSQRGKGTGGAETEIRIKILITGNGSKNNSHTWQGWPINPFSLECAYLK